MTRYPVATRTESALLGAGYSLTQPCAYSISCGGHWSATGGTVLPGSTRFRAVDIDTFDVVSLKKLGLSVTDRWIVDYSH